MGVSFSRRDVGFRGSSRRPIVQAENTSTRKGSDFSSNKVHQSDENHQTSAGGGLREAMERNMQDCESAWEHTECSLKGQGSLSDSRIEQELASIEPKLSSQKSNKSKKKKCVIL